MFAYSFLTKPIVCLATFSHENHPFRLLLTTTIHIFFSLVSVLVAIYIFCVCDIRPHFQHSHEILWNLLLKVEAINSEQSKRHYSNRCEFLLPKIEKIWKTENGTIKKKRNDCCCCCICKKNHLFSSIWFSTKLSIVRCYCTALKQHSSLDNISIFIVSLFCVALIRWNHITLKPAQYFFYRSIDVHIYLKLENESNQPAKVKIKWIYKQSTILVNKVLEEWESVDLI